MRTNLVNLATIAIIAKVSTIIAGYFQANLIFAKQPHIENEKLNYTKLFDDQNLTLALQHMLTSQLTYHCMCH